MQGGDDVRLYFEKSCPIDTYHPESGERIITEEEIKRSSLIRPKKLEKLINGEVVFEYEDICPYS